MKLKKGESFRAVVPFSAPDDCKVHIDHVLPSRNKGQSLIVYRVWGKNRIWWHEFLCSDEDMKWYIDRWQKKQTLNHV